MEKDNDLESRENNLRRLFNDFWNHYLPIQDANNPYEKLGIDGILRLKIIISDINNIITLKTTLSFVKHVYNILDIPTNDILNTIQEQSANANGFDVWDEKNRIVVEVKCNIPCANRKCFEESKTFGSKQKDGIITDLEHLLSGKIFTTEGFYKFMVLLETGHVNEAMTRLLLTPDNKRENSYGARINKIKNRIINNTNIPGLTLSQLNSNNVYVVYIKPEEL